MPEVFYVPAAAHDPWEWGWDAWVAIGTLLLAVATFLVIVVPLCREAKRRAQESKLFALLIVDEIGKSKVALAKVRAAISEVANVPTDRLNWPVIVRQIRYIDLPILGTKIDRVNILDDEAAMFVTSAYSSVVQLRTSVSPWGMPDEQVAKDAARLIKPLHALAVQAQKYVNGAYERTWVKCGRPLPVPHDDAAIITSIEEQLVAGYESGGTPESPGRLPGAGA